ncbi:hypothetical protein ATPR_3293 [Acetobacter tropicalis NBRC 101654]|uniref:Uncharacterized protein n=1 Tax=Acetobacter tropicalis NBRC 101654 TaxID=749388 RepID=F7VIU4_9PROT|nr:hypothetical protein ATPR_3293 [Acetobacter tropicalis NBRC 101654]
MEGGTNLECCLSFRKTHFRIIFCRSNLNVVPLFWSLSPARCSWQGFLFSKGFLFASYVGSAL